MRMNEIKVFITHNDAACSECGEQIGRSAWITLVDEKGALCLSCADLDHLLFLPAGDAALTRRASKYSTLKAVVLRWSRPRKRYERQGLLVEAKALEAAEQECLADAEIRARRKEREAARRAEQDQQYIEHFAERVRALYPGCPPGMETRIAEHACLKYSDRIGRTAAAKSLDPHSVELAVIAHIRHTHTNYDELLSQGWERQAARLQVRADMVRVLAQWQKPV
jgi:hypothetical protein